MSWALESPAASANCADVEDGAMSWAFWSLECRGRLPDVGPLRQASP